MIAITEYVVAFVKASQPSQARFVAAFIFDFVIILKPYLSLQFLSVKY